MLSGDADKVVGWVEVLGELSRFLGKTQLTWSSTYDGVAIAYATLSHVAGTGCNTLFVTHYPMVAEELAKEVSLISSPKLQAECV